MMASLLHMVGIIWVVPQSQNYYNPSVMQLYSYSCFNSGIISHKKLQMLNSAKMFSKNI